MAEPKSVPGYIELRLYEGDSLSEFRPLSLPTTSGVRADHDDGLEPWHGRALRVALAMKGGLSLAVWIGGAIAELDVLRRIRIYRDGTRPRALLYHIGHRVDIAGESAPLVARAEYYARYLATRGYDHVEFDVLAGASAGGLNGVLYATAQRAGVGFDSTLDTWLTTGSAWGLLQTGRPGRFDSVMRGDTYFWPEVSTAIDTIARDKESCEQLRASQVVVDLSATLIDAVDSSDRTTSEGRAQFRFVGDDDDVIADRAVPRFKPGQDDYAADVARIAYAARTTSSFPAMFEPALIFSGSTELEAEHGWEQPIGVGTVRAIDSPDMRMVFNAHRTDATTHPFRVVDGGLLDNIPIDRALNAVRDLPAEEHISRAIIYLDPSPKETAALFRRPTAYEAARPTLTYWKERGRRRFQGETQSTRTDVASRLGATVLASLRKRSVRESRDEEIEEVDLVRSAISVVKARNELLAVRMDGSAPTGDELDLSKRAYAIYRATSDLELLTPALVHPGEWLLGTDLPERPELIAVDRLGMVHVETAFRATADSLQQGNDVSDPQERILHGRQSLVDACLTTLSWIRAIENTAFQEGVLSVLDDRIEGKADVRRRRGIRENLNTIMRAARADRDAAILATLRRLQSSIRGRSLTTDGAQALDRWWISQDTEASKDLTQRWRDLDAIVEELFQISSEMETMPATAVRWSRTPWSQLRRGETTDGFACQLPLIFGGNGIPQPISSVRFHRIGSDVRPAKPTEYRKLLEDQLLRGYRGALARPLDELDAVTVHNYLEEATLRSNAKLAGLRTANLAGFLSADWRLNDWWWGRLDAAAGIVEFLNALPMAPEKRATGDADDPEPSHLKFVRIPKAEEVLDHVHDAILRQLDGVANSPLRSTRTARAGRMNGGTARAADPAELRARMVRGTQGLDSLSDSYRVAIASRTLRAASSALVRGTGRASVPRFAHWILRPLAAIAPSTISRPRLVLLFAFLVSGALLVWPTTVWPLPVRTRDDSTTLASTIVAISVVLLVWIRLVAAVRSKRSRLRRILEHTTTKVRTRAVIGAAERRAHPGRVALDIATIVTGAAVIAVELMYGMGTVLFWAALITFLGVAAAAIRASQTVPATLARRSGSSVYAAIGALVFVGATIALRAIVKTPDPDALGEQALWHAVGAGAIGFAIAVTMLAGCFARPRLLFAPVVLVALTAAATAMLVTFAFATFTAPVRQIAEVLAVGWVAGTVLWWSPWWRGRGTDPVDAPSDAAIDLDWDPVVERATSPVGARVRRRRPSAARAPAPA
ncbi:patatin-related protein [Agromyces ramosus]|uniref:Patatin-related protein n=1 Tax=Agromyces ramosus TaxID=33879 RepID=A0A4Q7MHK9_9MICO|nr:DUF3376 domain-containing protein [Agromyces ramosus]RZS67681.1 patatin-related protein [Agromyces ramosus]